MRLKHFTFPLIALALSSAHADIISGKIQDRNDASPIEGAAISVEGGPATLSEWDGSYTLNTAPVSATRTGRNRPLSAPAWNPADGSFQWNPEQGTVVIEVRALDGKLVDRFDSRSSPAAASYRVGKTTDGVHIVSLRSDRSHAVYRMVTINNLPVMTHRVTGMEPAAQSPDQTALPKSMARNNLRFEKEGYVTVTRQIRGSQDNVDIELSKMGVGGEWRLANLTTYTSYPEPGSEEWNDYNGGQYLGLFAALNGQQPESWVAANNIVAVHSRDFDAYKLKTLRVRQDGREIDAVVYDMCSDSDCGGCCSENAAETGFLIDMESYTVERFGSSSGIVEWMCLDCD